MKKLLISLLIFTPLFASAQVGQFIPFLRSTLSTSTSATSTDLFAQKFVSSTSTIGILTVGFLNASSTSASSTLKNFLFSQGQGTGLTLTNLTLNGQSTGCVTSTNGVITSTGVACGSGTGGFDFSVSTWGGNPASATTTLLLLNGGMVTGSSSIGLLSVGQLTATSTTASTSLQNTLFTQGQGTGLSVTNLSVLTSETFGNLTAANCDVKSSTAGVLSCGLDASGGGAMNTNPIQVGYVVASSSATSTYSGGIESPVIGARFLFATDTTATSTLKSTNITQLQATGISTTAFSCATCIANGSLANSTISGIALGQNLGALTNDTTLNGSSYNGSGAISDWGINLANGNNWTGLQTFGNSGTTTFSGGVEATAVGAQFLFATSTTATSTLKATNITQLQVTGVSATNISCATCIANGSLANSTISGISLGSNLGALTNGATLLGSSYNGSGAISDWDIDLSHGNNWTGGQTFGYVATTTFSGGIESPVVGAGYFFATSSSASTTLQNFKFSQGQGTGLTLTNLTLNGLATGCLTSTAGVVSSTGVACGTGSNSFSYPFTNTTYGGFVSGATSTVLQMSENTVGSSSVGQLTAGTVTATSTTASSTFINALFTQIQTTGLSATNIKCNTCIANTSLANSTISGISLGSNLAALTNDTTLNGSSYNGSAAISDWGINLGNVNNWTGGQSFGYTATTTLSAGTEGTVFGAQYFFATSSTATSTFAGGILAQKSLYISDRASTSQLTISNLGNTATRCLSITNQGIVGVAGADCNSGNSSTTLLGDWNTFSASTTLTRFGSTADSYLGDANTDLLTISASTTNRNGFGFVGETWIGDANTDNLTITASTSVKSSHGFFADSFIGDANTDLLTITSTSTFRTGANFSAGLYGTNLSLSGGMNVTGATSNSTFIGNRVGIGTSTPSFLLTLSTSTAPQLALSDGSNTSAAWTFRNTGGNFYMASTSPTTFATTTTAAWMIDTSGNMVFGQATTTYNDPATALIPMVTFRNSRAQDEVILFQNLASGKAISQVFRANSDYAHFDIYGGSNSAWKIGVIGDANLKFWDDTGAGHSPFQIEKGVVTDNNLYINAAGKVGVGTTTPRRPLSVVGADNGTAMEVNIPVASASITTADTFIEFTSSAGSIGSIAGTAVSGTIIYNTFTGSHWSKIEGQKPPVGSLLIATGKPTNQFRHLSESAISCQKASQKVYGVYGGTDKDGHDTVLSIGTGMMIVANKGEDIETGDLLMASDVCGAAEKQADGIVRNITAGKAMEDVNWKVGEKVRTISVVYLGG